MELRAGVSQRQIAREQEGLWMDMIIPFTIEGFFFGFAEGDGYHLLAPFLVNYQEPYSLS